MPQNKNKKSGFSFIELLVAITIMGMLAVMSVPGITRNMRENSYNEDIEKIWSLLNEARVNALVSKRCPNEPNAGTWQFSVSGLSPATVNLSCTSCSDPNTCSNSAIVESHTPANPFTHVQITEGGSAHFLPKTAHARLEDTTATQLKLTINETDLQKCTVITLDPIAGFPDRRKYENTNTCPPE